jgi:transketolase
LRKPPYEIALKPYGKALLELAARRPDVFCLGADLTRQTETDLIREQMPERFINVGMAEANMIGIAGGMARAGHTVFVNSFGVFCTRRCYDQIAMALAYPKLNVKIAGFMPGVSSPGGPSHQAIDDLALMRALPNMTVFDLSDATEITQAVQVAADIPGPVYLRLKRGEIPVIFGEGHVFDGRRAHVLSRGTDVCLIASGMMVPATLAAAEVLEAAGLGVTVVNSPVVKPLDAPSIVEAAAATRLVITAENHSVVGGLGSAVAEAMAEAGLGRRLLRIGLQDTFAESGSREFLFDKYGLSVQAIVNAAWQALRPGTEVPQAPQQQAEPGTYAPV